MSLVTAQPLQVTCLIIFRNVNRISAFLRPFLLQLSSKPALFKLHLLVVFWEFFPTFCLYGFCFIALFLGVCISLPVFFKFSFSFHFFYMYFLFSSPFKSAPPFLSFAPASNTLLQRKRGKLFNTNYNIQQIWSSFIYFITSQKS